MKKQKGLRIYVLLLGLLLVFSALPMQAFAVRHTVVRVGWPYQPGYQEVDDNGNLSGFNYEFLLRLAEKNNWELEFVSKNNAGKELTWDDSLSMLASGELDLMGCMFFSEERALEYDFPALASGQIFTSLFVREDSPLTSSDFTELNGISVAASMGTLNDEDLIAFAASSGFTVGQFLDYGNSKGVIKAVLDGTADAAVMASYQPAEHTRIIASFSPRPFYFATTKGNAEVLAALNQGMNSILLQDPYYSQKLSEKYSQIYSGQIPFSQQEQAFIAQSKPIRVCYSDAWFPLIQAGKDEHNPTGVIPDILERIARNTGLKFQFYHVATHEQALEDSANGTCDMMAICVYDLQHAQEYSVEMTDAYLQMQLIMVSKTKTDFRDMTVGTMADFPIFREAAEGENVKSRQYFSTVGECLEALRKGKVDSVVVGAYAANYYLALSKYNRFLRTNLPGQYAPICMAVSEANPNESLLLSILNKSISSLSSTEINRIMIDNTVRDGSGLEALVNRIPSTVVVLAFFLLLGISALVASMAAALIRKTKLERKLAEDQKAAAEKAAQQLRMDALTGLYNERGFDDVARLRLDEFPNNSWFLLDFDVDGFKYVNALYGIEQADQLLIALTHVVTGKLQPGEISGRIYGDHFVALLIGSNLEEIKGRIQSLNDELRAVIGHHLVIMSYGVYPIADTAAPISTLRDHAQVAKRMVKGKYKEFIAVYDDVLDQRQKEDVELILCVERAFLDGEFQVFFQPQYDIMTEKIVSAEALVRWEHDGRLIMPDRFIGLFEHNGIIEKLDYYMAEAVCAHLKEQLAAGLVPVPVSVNFSKSHLYDQMFLPKLAQIIADSRVPTNLLVAEFTEYTCLGSEDTFQSIIQGLHRMGVHVSLDDFGSGYSSLNILTNMDFDEIKLDKGFLKESLLDEKDKKMIRSILQLIHSLNVRTVAEGVETKEQLEFLRESGCDIVQGYYFSRPVRAIKYDELLERADESYKLSE